MNSESLLMLGTCQLALILAMGVPLEATCCNKRQFNASQWSVSSPSNGHNTTSETQCTYCNIQCDGCYGPDAGSCINCKHFNLSDSNGHWLCVSSCPGHYYNGHCLSECPNNTYHFNVDKPECLPCHSQCTGGCTGSTSWNCSQCLTHQMPDGQCVSSCPDGFSFKDNYSCSLEFQTENSDDTGEMALNEVVALSIGISMLILVIFLWVGLYFYVQWKKSTGNHDLFNNQTGNSVIHRDKKDTKTTVIELPLQQSAFAVNPTQYVDDWLDGERVTNADWLSGEQRVTLANPLFELTDMRQEDIDSEKEIKADRDGKRRSAFHSSETGGYCTDTEEIDHDSSTFDHASHEKEVQISDEATSDVLVSDSDQ